MTTTSNEYAQALFELAAGEDQVAETQAGLDMVMETLRETPEYRALLASPAIPRGERIAALESAFRGRLPDNLLGILRMMVTRGQMGFLNEMAGEFDELAQEYRGEAVAQVTSAVELSDAEKATLRENLEKRFARRIQLQCGVDPSLIGGMRVEVEGKVIDGSIRNKLDQIKEVMHS